MDATDRINVSRLGVPGTGIASFPALSDEQTWDLAFYVLSLRYEAANSITTGVAFDASTLQNMGSTSDQGWLTALPGSPKDKFESLAALRLHADECKAGRANQFFTLALTQLREAVAVYGQNDKVKARTLTIKASLEGVEPIELRLKTNDPKCLQNPWQFNTFGISPPVETLTAQLATVVGLVVIWKVGSRPSGVIGG